MGSRRACVALVSFGRPVVAPSNEPLPAERRRSTYKSRSAERVPEVDGAVRAGRLSATQAKEVAAAAAADPRAETKLVELAASGSLGELKAECASVKAAAVSDECERRDKIHRSRRFRHWTDSDGAFAFAGRTTTDQGALLLAALKPHQDRIFDQARKQQRRESRDAYAMDALVALAHAAQATPRGGDKSSTGPKALVHVRVDHAALVRGHTEAGETCEIAGVGPIPVTTAKAMMNDSFLAVLVTDGVDVQSVAHMGCTIPAHLRSALIERDPCCVVPGCTATEPLEIDHVKPLADGGPTTLSNLARLCSFHHDQKTYSGCQLTGTPGHWTWVTPDRPPSKTGCRPLPKASSGRESARPTANDPTSTSPPTSRAP